MSNALAIAGVTAVLKDLLDDGLIDTTSPARRAGRHVSASPPDRDPGRRPTQTRRLNLFLYQVTPNAAGATQLPVAQCGRRPPPQSAARARPALPADRLRRADLEAEILLGYAMQVLHETPVLTRAAIRSALNPPVPPVTGSLLPTRYQALPASELADQIEQIKITPAVLNTEECPSCGPRCRRTTGRPRPTGHRWC